MTDHYRRRSPLAHLRIGSLMPTDADTPIGVHLREVPFLGLINLRGNSSDPKFLAAVKKATRQTVPTEANTVAGKPTTTRIFWLGPDEWLVAAQPQNATRMLNACKNAISDANIHAAVTDVSESRTCFEISGSDARSVLAKGCAIDLHPSVFGPGQCAQTMFSKVGVLLTQTATSRRGDPTYEVFPLRSFAPYLWDWTKDAAAEYGLELGA